MNKKLLLVTPLLLASLVGCQNKERSSSSFITSNSTSSLGEEVTKEQWENAFAESKFENLKFSINEEMEVNSVDMFDDGPKMSASTKVSNIIEYDGIGIREISLNNKINFVLSREDFHEYYLQHEEVRIVSEESAISDFASQLAFFFGAKVVEDENAVSIMVENSEEEWTYCFKTDDPVLVENYLFEEDVFCFYKSFENDSLFVDLTLFEGFKQFKDHFDSATFVDGHYTLPSSLMPVEAEIENPTGTFDVYFHDGNLTKVYFNSDDCPEFFGGEDLASGSAEMVFESYGEIEVKKPTNVFICEHETILSSYNDDYHYTYCDDCGSIIEYGQHEYENGKCKVCGYAPTYSAYYVINGSECEHVDVYYNAITNEVVGVFIDGLTYYGETDEGDYLYICEYEECNLIVQEHFDNDQDGILPCEKVNTTTYYFFMDGEQVAEPLSYQDRYFSHDFFVKSINGLADPLFEDTEYIFLDATLMCNECEKEINVTLWCDESYLETDSLTFYNDEIGYGYIYVEHEFEDDHCIYCGHTQDELNLL